MGAALWSNAIGSAGNSIADVIDEHKQRGRQAAAMRQMMVDGLGKDPDAVNKMTLEQVSGALQGAALKSANAQKQAQMDLEHAQMVDVMAQGPLREAQAARANAQADKINDTQSRKIAAETAFNSEVADLDPTDITKPMLQKLAAKNNLDSDQIHARGLDFMKTGDQWNLKPGATIPGPNGSTVVPTGPNSMKVVPAPKPAKPPIVAESVDELDEYGKKTGRQTLKVSGDPDAVKAWTDSQNAALEARRNAPVIMINPQNQQVRVAPGDVFKYSKLNYKMAPTAPTAQTAPADTGAAPTVPPAPASQPAPSGLFPSQVPTPSLMFPGSQ